MITNLLDNQIFVFGSNLSGRHGKGAALQAVKFGAKYGVGIGRTGQCYAIPTKGFNLEVLKLEVIKQHVEVFLDYVQSNSQLEFLLTPIGCGLAGYDSNQIAPMFNRQYENLILPVEFKNALL